ncbi:intein-containing Rv2578c family radical SAM protein [Amycolatopsis thermophila]|uniref:DNA repair photolyase n=1 Tax=Amycolatopsis thermophila TaxID=206084 RepID=A0ABU0F061_9PSEU|nr:intein-containing Rv2578c family radical SAM protein [Amycolatopsis thermophila]MDQ0380739.1 DNA repair photolyase [Amycolatopsis thermophila]
MRWENQRAGREPQLPLPGLVRTVTSPEFRGVTFHEVHARSVLNKVPGRSMVPFDWTVNPYRGCSHACTYCLAGDTPILMADGRTRPLADLRVGDEIQGTEVRDGHRRYVTTTVLAHWSTVKPAHRITLRDGTSLVASGDHRFLTAEGWKHVTGPDRPHLRPGDTLVGTGRYATAPVASPAYREGYLAGRIRGETRGEDPQWQQGFLAGVFDESGTFAHGDLRIAEPDPEVAEAVALALKSLGFEVEHAEDIRLTGGFPAGLRFLHTVDPALTRKRAIAGEPVEPRPELAVVAVEDLGREQTLFDVTTGTGDFLADGVVSHNCFARKTHTYLDFDAGRDFDTQVVVKVNAPEVLAAQLRKPGWKREHVAMGTNTDPYQRAEGRYRLMPGIIRALAGSGTPFSILTKGTVLTRDLPLLTSAAEDVGVGMAVSIALLDRELQRSLEPGTPSPRARLDLVRRITDAGLPCHVMVAPVLPGLTDTEEALDPLFAEIAAAGATRATVLALHLRPGAREWFGRWLGAHRPDLAERYREIYGRGSYAMPAYRRALSARVAPLLRRHGLNRREDSHRLPAPREPERPAPGEQLSLL